MSDLKNEISWLRNKAGSVRLKEVDIEYISDNWEILTDTDEPMDFRKFLFRIMEKAEKQPTLISDPKDLETIEKLSLTNKELSDEIFKLQTTIREIENKPDPGTLIEYRDRQLNENQLLITLSASIDYFLSVCVEKESKRTGKEISKGMLLINLFWKQIKDGPGDHLPMIWSDGEIRSILHRIKNNQEQENGQDTDQ